MSFILDNRYFISAMRSRLNPLDLAERRVQYQKEFRSQVQQRIATAYAAADTAEELTIHYRELLQVLHQDELDWILESIFFERECDQLIVALLPEFAQIGQDRLGRSMVGAELFLNQSTPYDNSLCKGYLKAFFMEVLEASENDWKEEGSNRNPLVNLMETYIMTCITQGHGRREELSKVLLHYAKLWQVYYSIPFSMDKATVLLHRLCQGYQQLAKEELKTDLLEALRQNSKTLKGLLPQLAEFPLDGKKEICHVPYQTMAGGGYSAKKREFYNLLENDRVYFIDLSLLPISQLLKECNAAEESASQAFLRELGKRMTGKDRPDTVELHRISAQYRELASFRPILRKILERLVRENYIFFW